MEVGGIVPATVANTNIRMANDLAIALAIILANEDLIIQKRGLKTGKPRMLNSSMELMFEI